MEGLLNPRLLLGFTTMLMVSGIGNTFPVFFPALLVVSLTALGVFCALTSTRRGSS